jgi:hypothetical protein
VLLPGEHPLAGQSPEAKRSETGVRPAESVFICVHLWFSSAGLADQSHQPRLYRVQSLCPRNTRSCFWSAGRSPSQTGTPPPPRPGGDGNPATTVWSMALIWALHSSVLGMQNSYDTATFPPAGPRSPSASSCVRSNSTFRQASSWAEGFVSAQETHNSRAANKATPGNLINAPLIFWAFVKDTSG